MIDWKQGRAEALAIAKEWSGLNQPGGAVVLFDTHGIREHASGGFASIEHAIPFTPDTTSRFASISKHMLAVLLLQNGVSLEASLGSLLPGLSDVIGSVTLGRALDMTGALPDMMELFWQLGVPYTATLDANEIFATAQRFAAVNAAPGTEMSYSNTGWRLAQRILEARLGIPYAKALAQLMSEFALPIRFPYDETEIVPGLATGYWRDGANWRRGRYGFHFSASGGIAGSAAALASWASALMAERGSLAGVFRRLTAPRPFKNDTDSVYRLGLVCSKLEGIDLVGHGGSLPGYRNHLLMVPSQGVGVVVMTNREEDALWPCLRVIGALLGENLPAEPALTPTGLFAERDGPFWAEMTPGAISFMGGYERLVANGANAIRSLPAYLDVQLTVVDADTFSGTIGGVQRRLSRVHVDTKLDGRLAGRWRERTFGLDIEVRANDTARMAWIGDSGTECSLTPLSGGRALADLSHGPWRYRPCLALQGDDTLRLSGPRARILQFDRIA